MALSEGLSGSSLFKRLMAADISPFRQQNNFLVLDIGSSSVKVAEVVHTSAGPRVTALGVAPLPPTAIQSNVIQDEAAVVDAIRSLLTEKKIRSTQVVTAVPGPAVIVKKVILPAQSGAAVETAVLAEAGQLIPDSLDNVNLDYQVIDLIETGNKMEVLVVAVKKDIVTSYAETIRAAGLEPVVVDVDYFALENMFEANYDTPGGHAVALVNVGARYSSINILKAGRSMFTGDVPIGGAEYIDALGRQLGVSPADAEVLKQGGKAGGVEPATAEPVLTTVTEFLVDEIQRALSFFWTAATDEPLGGIILSGGTAHMPGVSGLLTERLGCAVEVADPFRRMRVDHSADRTLAESLGPALAVTAGLVTRRPGDK